MSDDWYWEGNVAATLAAHLGTLGWNVQHVADTASRHTGPDIRAAKDGRTLLVEVKGYPSTLYARGQNRGKPKPTNPSTQARHWFAEALSTAILRQSDAPSASVAVAFPDFPAFLNLLGRTRQAFIALSLGVFLVRESGEVVEIVALA